MSKNSATTINIRALPTAVRNAFVITYLPGPDGSKHTVSKYGDMIWDFRPLFPHAARGKADKFILWERAPASWRASLKGALHAFMMFARPGGISLEPATLPKRFVTLNAFAKWCDAQGIGNFASVSPFDVVRYIEKLRSEGNYDRTIGNHVSLLRRVYEMREYLNDCFSAQAARELSSKALGPLWEPEADEARRTELIPLPEAAALFSASLKVLEDASRVLALRDALEDDWNAQQVEVGRQHWGASVKHPEVRKAGFEDVYAFESRLNDIRTAAYIVLAQSTGCRVHELGDARVGCVYDKVEDGIRYYWLKSSTRKIGDGPVKWLAPEVAQQAAKILEWHSAPLRKIVCEQLKLSQAAYCALPPHDERRAELALEILELERNVDRLFLSLTAGNQVSSTATYAHNKQLNAFAKRMGIQLSSRLHTHRFRRTYAVIVVRLNKGVRVDLITLRHHFKHSSLLMTEWYAGLSDADLELLELLEEENDIFDMALVEDWLEPGARLAGGLGAKIKAYAGKHHEPIVFKSRKEFLEVVRDGMKIRGTGHSWCLAENDDCGGQGLFEAFRCGDCGNSVIDENQLPIWECIRAQQLELLEMDDIGPGGRTKALAALKRADAVLDGLLEPESEEVPQ
ncbi:tyrosine-type recombinase/integrase [uncultured Dechloromonas sp.]|uniref:tyrosine-type recombinase/integrase n=1 Tax=uncultured Dechloromonas sp. TaxID=171719 RepID=UPI0025FD9AD9|nr:tyrosine-type recombinase/integrase [uncultured Dechloromonas sp.]